MKSEDKSIESILTRDRGFLTEVDREFLMNRFEESSGKARTRKHRLRRRTRDAFIDCNLLRNFLREDSVWIFGSLLDRRDVELNSEEELVWSGVKHLISFLYTHLGGDLFFDTLRPAVEEVYMRQNVEDDVFVEGEIQWRIVEKGDPVPLEELYERYHSDNDSVTGNQLKALWLGDYISDEEFVATVEEDT